MPLVPAEKVLIAALTAHLGAGKAGTEAPGNLGDVVPFHRVTRVSGSDENYPFDAAQIDVDTFGADALAAADAAEDVRAYLRTTLPGQTFAGAYVNSVTTTLAPVWTPWDNTNVRRYTASYRITLHTLATSTAP